MTESLGTRIFVIVDDEPSITNAIQRTLNQIIQAFKRNNIEIKVFNDSPAALEFLRTATNANVALVLTDFHMPEVNGAAIAAEAKKKNIPVAIMSGSWDEKQDKEVNEKAGEVKKFNKPYNPDELIIWIREQLAISTPPPQPLEYSSEYSKREEDF